MAAGHTQDAGSVFVNCPFDAGYKGLYTRTLMQREQKSHIALDLRPEFFDILRNKARQASQGSPNWWATFLVEAAER